MQRTEHNLLKIPLKDHAKDLQRFIFTQIRSLIWLGSVSFDKLYQNACLEYWSTFERFFWDEIFKNNSELLVNHLFSMYIVVDE